MGWSCPLRKVASSLPTKGWVSVRHAQLLLPWRKWGPHVDAFRHSVTSRERDHV